MNRKSISTLTEEGTRELLADLVDQLEQHSAYFEDYENGWTEMLDLDADEILMNPTHEDTVDLLEVLIAGLDKLDNDDFFGTEGWRSVFGFDE